METRKLGRQGLEVAALGLGCMGMSAFYKTGADAAECEATLVEAVDAGVTLFDTAEVYGPFSNEELLGRVLGGSRRDRVVLATKFGFDLSQSTGSRLGAGQPPRAHPGGRRAVPAPAADRPDRPPVPAPGGPQGADRGGRGTMAELVQAGKVRYLGLSEASATTLRRAHAVHPISALQSEYSLFERGVERTVLPACRELGIGLVPYSPLGRGFLTGQRTRAEEFPEGDSRRGQPRLQAGNFDANLKLLEKLEAVAARARATPGQVALAWLLAQGPDIVPIFGTTRRTRLRENLGATAVQLAACDQFLLDQVFAPGNTAGERYLPSAMATLDRDP